ncbi:MULTISPECIES: pentapeptide repeat-containing protein [Paenibacillus]|uniref:pentapeptide repeat-containing protein n=1 Tax=Paenibacillus TaxID=44249 RepID=UPI0004F78166|nr:pentapeptide repeat-containing protein [Paenibacillus odorifer]AIQ72779.1 bTB/POZ domain-containing protein KCTD9 [Paenibacillus odorifer]MEC0132439.1 pentapeptide repeat-containing protein [Paenibacillus odorifer]MEC0223741.1 pentapeptide repeat-containing protein [Paenibacillus odorifer]OME34815.1 bTB/POZ domain-containing protein KCTD9 [Paenibacillus odorifer]
MNFKIDSPKIADPDSLLPEQIYSLQTKDEFSCCGISDTVIDNQEANKVSFDRVIFKNVTITECSLTGIELMDVIFDRCDLSNVDFTNGIIHRTEFRNCKLIGTDFTRGRFQNVRVVDCIGDFATFRFANLKQVAFESSSLMSSDYYQSNFQKISFSECNMDQATLSGSKLNGIDLSDCEFSGLIVDIKDLEGCIISPQQAVSFVGLLGLVIK